MLISEVIKQTKLTKKAVEYYTEKGFVIPKVLDNSYRDYSKDDVLLLKKIKILRNLDLSVLEIRKVLLEEDETILKKAVELKQLSLEIDEKKAKLLSRLSKGASYGELEDEINLLERKQSINKRFIYLFPGFLGKMLRFQFGEFLNEPIKTKEQEDAYNNIINFLDNMPEFKISEQLEQFLEENTKDITDDDLLQMMEQKNNPMHNIDEFMSENDEKIKKYLEYKNTDEYKNSKVAEINELFKVFMFTSGFHNIFISNMRILSNSYNTYYELLLEANEKFIKKYN